MGQSVYLLPHQERFLQSPFCFKNIRWHFLLGGYGAGKTRSLVMFTLMLVEKLQGVKDDGGSFAKLLVGGYTYAHLEQTYMIDLNSYLDQSKTAYRYDTKNHIMYIGTVQIIFVQLSEPDRIFGQSIYCFEEHTKIMTLRHNRVMQLSIKDVLTTDKVYTRKGWKKVLAVHDNGYKECMRVGKTLCTPDHRYAVGDNWVEARNLTSDTPLIECTLGNRYNLSETYVDIDKKIQGKYHVYDLTVEDCHEFFADGILAHNCALLDEIDELPEDVMIEATKSVSQRCRQKLKGQRSCFIVSASTAQGYKGFYRLYTHYKKQKIGFVLIRALTRDNIYLPKEYIEDLEKSFTETERKVYMEGEFLSVSQGRVIPGFDWERNFEDDDMDLKLPPNAKVYIGQDFNTGYSRASAWVSDPVTGTAHCIKYYDFQDVMEAPNIFRFDFPTQDIYWIPDVTSKDSFPQFAKALRQHNIHIIYRSKSPMVEDSCFLLSSLCYQGKLIVHTQASAIAEAFAQASRDKNNKIPKGVGENSPIHAIDGARYAVSYMALVLPEFRDIRRSLMTHLPTYRNIIENNKEEDEEVKQVGSGYMQIEGSAYLH